jgi:hypothetical protein
VRIRVVTLLTELHEVTFLISRIKILNEVIELADRTCRSTSLVSINATIKLKRVSIME